MSQKELLERIKTLEPSTIIDMSSDGLAMLTDNFRERLVRAVIMTGTNNYSQRKLFNSIKKGYKNWMKDTNIMWGTLPQLETYPDFFKEIFFNIECGYIMKPDGYHVEQRAKLSISPVTTLVQAFNNTSLNSITDNIPATPTPASTPEATTANADGQTPAPTKLQAQETQIAEKNATIEELQRRIADYESRFAPKDIKSKKVSAMSGKQHVILFLAMLAEHNRLPNSRANLSQILSFVASRKVSTMEDYLKEAITQEECEALAKEFDSGQGLSTDCPFIATLIRQLPEKLKKDKSKKNSAKAKKS